jgi:hypothetical protein
MSRRCLPSFLAAALGLAAAIAAPPQTTPAHVWEKQEITLKAQNSYPNPYLSVDVWVDLAGPGFNKRVYGFWDGENTFRIRIVATAPGQWSWKSGSNPPDPGLSGKSGGFRAVEWSEAEKEANANRRGFLRATPSGHALQYADGTPYFLQGDTWWTVGTWRYPWYDDDTPRPIGPSAGFKDYVSFRKSQGYNLIAVIAAFPGWANDRYPAAIDIKEGGKNIQVRAAWPAPGISCCGPETALTAKDEHNEGGLPFLFPGRVPGYENVYPDVDRINPAYFKYLDRKLDYLQEHGFAVFLEALRRDLSQSWRRNYKWPDSYTRYLLYLYTRYGAGNVILSPIHLDTNPSEMPSSAFLPAINALYDKYGPPPFGNLSSTNTSPSTLVMWKQPGMDSKFLTLHQTGNKPREHGGYWYLTEEFFATPTLPAFAGEPYYSGGQGGKLGGSADSPPGGSEADSRNQRSSMFGTFLSGGLAGYIYGSFPIERADIEPGAAIKMWDAFPWAGGNLMKTMRAFVFSQGKRYQDLIPSADFVLPNRTQDADSFEGWAYAAATKEKDFVLVYWEKDCPTDQLRGVLAHASYEAKWFDPRKSEWRDAGAFVSNMYGVIRLPKKPTADDWGMQLVLKNVVSLDDGAAARALGRKVRH